jgi:signal transduction histidine kinase
MQVIAVGVRNIMSELYPSLLAKTGLVSSIKSLVTRFKRATLIETRVVHSLSCGEVDLPIDAKFAIYRVTQEALNNIEKHSDATHTLVTVKSVMDELVICIEDNGKGFQKSGSTLSRGLKNIRERAAEIGAKVAWQRSSSFGTGTAVTISLPVRQENTRAVENATSSIG